jgi:hypothetical protein
MNTNTEREAVVLSDAKLETVKRYLPSNYTATQYSSGAIVIEGQDSAGWTLSGYVIPRLASGMIVARELVPHN